MRAFAMLLVLLLPGLGAACSVDGSFLDDGVFECSGPSDCGDGWGCLRATPYTDNFCAPECAGSTCDGVCIGGEQPLCLRGCLIAEDGTPGPCQSEGFSCIRTSIQRDDGVCYPIDSCATHADCPSGDVCLTELFRDTMTAAENVDNLFCVPKATAEGACPAGSRAFSVAEGYPEPCVPQCSASDTRCPPGFACLTFLERVFGESYCSPGWYGLSCQDDTNCFLGQCLDSGTAQGKLCTLTCNEASRLYGGCETLGLRAWDSGPPIVTLVCASSAPSSDRSGLCVPRYGLGYPGCTPEPGSAYECRSDLECFHVTDAGGTEFDMCSKRCMADGDCNTGFGGDPMQWPFQCDATGMICVFRSADGV